MCALNTVDSPFTDGIHKRTVLSEDAEPISVPFGVNSTSLIASLIEFQNHKHAYVKKEIYKNVFRLNI